VPGINGSSNSCVSETIGMCLLFLQLQLELLAACSLYGFHVPGGVPDNHALFSSPTPRLGASS
jgi:hypothetical protein